MEFKRLSDVEVVAEPTESANVLIEENGVIKKAPKTAVGGGSTEWDAVLETTSWNAFESYSWVSGSYADIKNKVLAGERPNVLIRYTYEYGDVFSCIFTPLYFEVPTITESTLWIVITSRPNEECFWLGINPDGTFSD